MLVPLWMLNRGGGITPLITPEPSITLPLIYLKFNNLSAPSTYINDGTVVTTISSPDGSPSTRQVDEDTLRTIWSINPSYDCDLRGGGSLSVTGTTGVLVDNYAACQLGSNNFEIGMRYAAYWASSETLKYILVLDNCMLVNINGSTRELSVAYWDTDNNSWTYPLTLHAISILIPDNFFELKLRKTGTSLTVYFDETAIASGAFPATMPNMTSFKVGGGNAPVDGSSLGVTDYFYLTFNQTPVTSSQVLDLVRNPSNNSYTDTSSFARTIESNNIAAAPAVPFNGSNSYLSIGNLLGLTALAKFTIEATIDCKDQVAGRYPVIISTQGGWGDSSLLLSFDDAGAEDTAKFALHWNSTSPLLNSVDAITFDTTHTVKITHDGTTTSMYVDNVLKSSTTAKAGVFLNLGFGGSMRIGGGNWDGSGSYFIGTIDNLKVYNYVV